MTLGNWALVFGSGFLLGAVIGFFVVYHFRKG
jgi:hypothetical protein